MSEERVAMHTMTYAVSGLTCQHCVHAVEQEVRTLPGVERVDVALVAGGTSTVTVEAQAPLRDPDVRAAVDEAGYDLL